MFPDSQKTKPVTIPNMAGAQSSGAGQVRIFESADWLSFAITTGLALAVYRATRAPNVTLELSGIFSVGAAYAGVPGPPGYPLWILYAWMFTKLLPFSNIAWRAG